MIYGIVDEKGNVKCTFQCAEKGFPEIVTRMDYLYFPDINIETNGIRTFKRLQTFLYTSQKLWLVKEKANEKYSVLVGRLTAGNDTRTFPLVDLSKVFGKEDSI